MDISKLKIDKRTWKPVKFGEIVSEPKEVCKNIVAEGIEHVVGLEHIDSGDLHLRKSANIEESTTFTKKFRKGDVLFGRRRAYLKKAAQAEFDGICSGDITVFRAKKDKLILQLLPFIVNNDKFFDYAVKHSAGGLSPRVKFKDLANYEFLLPPKEEQAKLAELLWAMDDVIEKEKIVLEKYSQLKRSRIKELYFGNKATFNLFPLSEITSLITKGTTPSSIGESFKDTGVNFIKIETLTEEGEFIKDKIEYIDEVTHEKLKRSQIHANDVLFSIAGALGRCAIVPKSICPANTNQALAIIRLKENVNPEFILEYLKSDLIKKHIEKVQVKGAQPNLSLKNINDFFVPVPSKEIQIQISKEVKGLYNVLYNAKNQIYNSQFLQNSLINQIF
jgi:type I restriction enzyme S subunit